MSSRFSPRRYSLVDAYRETARLGRIRLAIGLSSKKALQRKKPDFKQLVTRHSQYERRCHSEREEQDRGDRVDRHHAKEERFRGAVFQGVREHSVKNVESVAVLAELPQPFHVQTCKDGPRQCSARCHLDGDAKE